jgi:hypothetical protein
MKLIDLIAKDEELPEGLIEVLVDLDSRLSVLESVAGFSEAQKELESKVVDLILQRKG